MGGSGGENLALQHSPADLAGRCRRGAGGGGPTFSSCAADGLGALSRIPFARGFCWAAQMVVRRWVGGVLRGARRRTAVRRAGGSGGRGAAAMAAARPGLAATARPCHVAAARIPYGGGVSKPCGLASVSWRWRGKTGRRPAAVTSAGSRPRRVRSVPCSSAGSRVFPCAPPLSCSFQSPGAGWRRGGCWPGAE